MRTRSSRRKLVGRGVVLAAGAAVVGLATGASPASAQADGPPNATGPCSARAELSNGVTADPYASSGVYVIPRSGTANYEGSVGVDATDREFNGQVVVKTPPFLPDISLADAWTWDGSGSGVEKSGSVDWDLGGLPGGVIFTVEGFHQDAGARCEGSVEIEIEGGLFDSPITPVSLGGTALALAGVGGAMIPRRGGAA